MPGDAPWAHLPAVPAAPDPSPSTPPGPPSPPAPQPNLLTTTLPGGLVCWQLFKRWPAERLEEIGGGRRTYVQAGPPPAEEAAARLARALQAVEGFPPEVQGEQKYCAGRSAGDLEGWVGWAGWGAAAGGPGTALPGSRAPLHARGPHAVPALQS